jgi:hypothetical protein
MKNHEAKIFPKLFIGDAVRGFTRFVKQNNYNYTINILVSREELLEFIELYSGYKNYSLPVIIGDISYFNKETQSILLKFMDDTDLKLILLASRDNVIETIISRVREYRKFYIPNNESKSSFISIKKAREMFNNDVGRFDEDSSEEDKMIIYNRYNPMLSYDSLLVSKFSKSDQEKLLCLIEG